MSELWRTVPLTRSLDFSRAQPAGARCRYDRPDRGRVIEALAHVPGPPGFLGRRLQIAPSHVEAGGIAPDGIPGVAESEVAGVAADRNDQLHLEMEVLG